MVARETREFLESRGQMSTPGARRAASIEELERLSRSHSEHASQVMKLRTFEPQGSRRGVGHVQPLHGESKSRGPRGGTWLGSTEPRSVRTIGGALRAFSIEVVPCLIT